MRPETPKIAMSNSSFCDIVHQFLGKIGKLNTLGIPTRPARKSPMQSQIPGLAAQRILLHIHDTAIGIAHLVARCASAV
jgi:hypothetical protein